MRAFRGAARNDPEAGLEFVRRVKAEDPDMPALVQSTDESLAERGPRPCAAFLHKHSHGCSRNCAGSSRPASGLVTSCFVNPATGVEVARVPDLAGMAKTLRTVPGASLRYHASRNHFSNWCMARTEFALAARIRPWKVSDFKDVEELRTYLVEAFAELPLGSPPRRGRRLCFA